MNIRIAAFGEELGVSSVFSRAEFDRWPLNAVKCAGFSCIPGFIISASAVALANFRGTNLVGPIWSDVLLRLAELLASPCLPLQGVPSLIIEWKASPHLTGIPSQFEALDLDWCLMHGRESDGILLDALRFIERYSVGIIGLRPASFARSRAGIKGKGGCSRDWDLSTAQLMDVVAQRLADFESDTRMPFPRGVPEQLRLLLDRITTTWVDAFTGIDDDLRRAEPWLSVSVRMGLRRHCHSAVASGFIPSLNTDNTNVQGAWALGRSIDEIEAGLVVEVQPISALIRHRPRLATVMNGLIDWLSRNCPIDASLSFVATEDHIFVDDIEHRPPDLDALCLAVSRCSAGKSTRLTALLGAVSPKQIADRTTSRMTTGTQQRLRRIGIGIPAGPGVQSGVLCVRPETIKSMKASGTNVIFVSDSPEPELIGSVLAADGVVFARGGATSHVAVIARCASKPCVLGVGDMRVPNGQSLAVFGDMVVKEGEWITVDGTNGHIFTGKADNIQPGTGGPDLEALLNRCDALASVMVYANIDTADEARSAFALGARGVGLCRMEHLIPKQGATESLQRSIVLGWLTRSMSGDLERARRDANRWPESTGATAALLDMERTAFESARFQALTSETALLSDAIANAVLEIYRSALDKTVVIRLLDPPLSEFVNDIVLRSLFPDGLTSEERDDISSLLEDNESSLGLRGARVCLLISEITRAQIRGLIKAAKAGDRQCIDILIPFVVDGSEVLAIRRWLTSEIQHVPGLKFRLGTMIETPRAALIAGDLADISDYLSVGTNDLSQFVWAASRDGAENGFLSNPAYSHIVNPFIHFDQGGVGNLIKAAVDAARIRKPGIEIGLCGEHAGKPSVVAFCQSCGINYVSVAPFRVPTVRLACGQAAVKEAESPKEGSLTHESNGIT